MAVTYLDIYSEYGEARVKQLATDQNYIIVTEDENSNSGHLELGTRYKIIGNTGANFTNVGATDNNIGTYFECTSGAVTPTWGTGGMLQVGMSPDDMVTVKITAAETELNALALKTGNTVDLENKYQQQFIKEHTMYLLYALIQQEKQGEDERQRALSTLSLIWGRAVFDAYTEDTKIAEAPRQPLAYTSTKDWSTWNEDNGMDWA